MTGLAGSRCGVVAGALAVGLAATIAAQWPERPPGTGVVTLIHIGDIHGHLMSRPDARDVRGRRVGGLARVYSVIESIRARHPDGTLLVNVGDALQGSAEALFTRGQAVIDVLDLFGVDAFVPGNWDYVYGVDRFIETFVGLEGRAPLVRWPTIAANLYFATPDAGIRSPYVDRTGEQVLPPYVLRHVGGVRVAVIGITTMRGPRALGASQTRGIMFTPPERAVSDLVRRLRSSREADVVVVASELELANNVRLAERTPGIDVILSGDMHELTTKPIVTPTGAVIVEEGQDGTAVGELTLTVERGRVARRAWRSHRVTESVPEHPKVAARVAEVRAAFVRGARFDGTQRSPITGAMLRRPLDEVVGYTRVPLHRANPATDSVPAVLEGSSHNFLADAVRASTGADIALIRGFRFGTHVRPGPITRADLYHFLPIGAQVARVDGVPGAVIVRQLEASLQGALDSDPGRWTGGWFVGTSGLDITVDPYRPAGQRARDVRLAGVPLDTTGARRYSVAGLWFPTEPRAVSKCAPCVSSAARIDVIGLSGAAAADSTGIDAVEIVARHLAGLPDSTVAPTTGRVRMQRPLPAPAHGFPVLQPLSGAREQADSGARASVPTRAPARETRRSAGQQPSPARH